MPRPFTADQLRQVNLLDRIAGMMLQRLNLPLGHQGVKLQAQTGRRHHFIDSRRHRHRQAHAAEFRAGADRNPPPFSDRLVAFGVSRAGAYNTILKFRRVQVAMSLKRIQDLFAHATRLRQDCSGDIRCCLCKPVGIGDLIQPNHVIKQKLVILYRCAIRHEHLLIQKIRGSLASPAAPYMHSIRDLAYLIAQNHQPKRRVRIPGQSMQTKLLSANAVGFRAAADLLQEGELVAFPTETVYGLGGDARNDMAVARIFEAKGRPRFNPLIVHVNSISAAREFVEWPEQADILAQAFWPGPMTLVLPLKAGSGLSPLVTADLPTLAIRVPAHPVAQSLLGAFDGPVAAPSANPSGRISPTTAEHVMNGLAGRIAAVLDGGPCEVGVESTIIGLANTPILLRPGGLPIEVLEAALQGPLTVHTSDDPLTAPGQLASHYAPDAKVRLNAAEKRANEVLLGFGSVTADLNLSPAGDLTEAAANLFHHLHALDAKGAAAIAVTPIPDRGLGRAINDRLRRAAAPRP